MKPPISTILVFAVYLVGVFIFVGIRDAKFQNRIIHTTSLDQSIKAQSLDKQKICGLPTCLRVSATELSHQIQSVFKVIFHRFAGYDPAYFGGEGTIYFDVRLSIILAEVLFRIIALLPILFVAVLLFATVRSQLVFLILTFLSLSGWGPWLYVNWYRFIGQFVDWPKAWWDFLQPVALYDFGAVGFVFMLILYLSIRKRIRIWEAVALTAFGQSIFEHLGLVTGVSIFVFELLHEETVELQNRFKSAVIYLGACGIASILVFIGIYTSIVGFSGLAVDSGEIAGIGQALTGYLQEFWIRSGRSNFQALNILMANFISLLWPPAVAGILLACLMIFTNVSSVISGEQIRRRAVAGVAVVIGFVAASFVGLFVSGYHSEAGRQLLPLISCLVFATAYQCYWLAIKIGTIRRLI